MPVIEFKSCREQNPRYKYRVDTDLAPLGVGGMGVVYQGKQIDLVTNTGRDVAIKFLKPNLNPAVIERARREADIRLRTDNLIEMIDFVETEHLSESGPIIHYHVVSELIPGVSLLDLLQGKLCDSKGVEIEYAKQLYQFYQERPEQFAIFITRKVLNGLFVLHANNYVHRDIDPSNIMITNSRQIKIIDFGVAKSLHEKNNGNGLATKIGTFIGKPAYSAPELVSGDVPNHKPASDLYSVGIMLYVMMTGKLPFSGSITEISRKVISEPTPVKNIKNGSLRKIIAKATEKSLKKRYASSAEFLVALDRVKSETYSSKKVFITISIVVAISVIAGIILGTLI